MLRPVASMRWPGLCEWLNEPWRIQAGIRWGSSLDPGRHVEGTWVSLCIIAYQSSLQNIPRKINGA